MKHFLFHTYFLYPLAAGGRHKDQKIQPHLERNTTVNRKLLAQKLAALKGRNIFASHSQLFLNFKWSLINER